MKKGRTMRHKVLAWALSLVLVLPLTVVSALADETPGVQYEQLELNKDLLTGNGIGTAKDYSTAMLDDYYFYDKTYADEKYITDGYVPADHQLTVGSVTYTLPEYEGNDCIRLSTAAKSATLNLQTIGVYEKIYVLATAGGVSPNTPADFSVTLTYTTADQSGKYSATTSYTLYDWYNTNPGDGRGVYTNVRRTSGGYADGSTDGGPVLQSSAISVDTSRLLKSITFTYEGSNASLFCAVFAVTGATPAGAPKAPVATAATKTEGDASGKFTANWESVSDATGYRLDVATDRKFTSILSAYNNKNVGNETSFEISGTGISANTTYYYRVRAVNDKGQSLSSNRISTDLPIWLKNALEDTDLDKVAYDAENNKITFKQPVTLKDTLVLPEEDTTVIDLGGNTVTAPEGKPAISAGTGSNVELSVTGGGASGGLVGNGTDENGDGAPVIDFSNATGSKIAVENSTVTGSSGSDAEESGDGGSGGAGIAASGNTQIEVGTGSTVSGGDGGSSASGNGGAGGNGITGGKVTVSEGGSVTGGDGGDATGEDGTGGSGGTGITGSNPSNNGNVTGGDGGNGAGGGGTGGSAGAGGGTPGSDGSTCVHVWTYSASGNKIIAYCDAQGVGDCEYRGDGKAVTLTLTANNANYSGSAYTGASVTNGITPATKAAAGSIFYQGTGTTVYASSTTPPTNAGTYQASVTVGEQTATADFIITPAVAMANYVYNTEPSIPIVTSGIPENAGVTVYYSTYSNIGTNPTHRIEWADMTGTTLNVGTYYMAAYMETTGIGKVTTFKVTQAQYLAPAAPTVSGFTVTVDEADREKKLEYSLDGTNWISVPKLSSSGSFDLTGLAAGTDYTIRLRQKASADGNYTASPASDPANWRTLDEYSVAYNANGGTGTVPASVTSSGSVTVASGSGLRRTGYTFTGWKDGSGNDHAPGSTVNTGMTLYAQWTANSYTVKFDANGGIGAMADKPFIYDAPAALSTNSFTKGGYHFAGWATSPGGSVAYVDGQNVKNLADSGTVTLYAVWVENRYVVSGTVSSGCSDETVAVTLMRGSTQIGSSPFMIRDGSGPYTWYYSFADVPAGTYTIVAEQTVGVNKRTATVQVIVIDEDVTKDITMPSSNIRSILDVKEDTRPVVVGGLDAEAETKAEESKSVTVTMTVEKQEEQQLPESADESAKKTQEAIAEIKAEASGNTLEFMDIEVKKDVTVGIVTTTEKLTETNTVMEIVIPYDMTGKSNITVYRCHGGSAETLIRNDSQADGTFYLDTANNLIYVYAQKFSTYAIGYSVPGATTGSGGSDAPSYPVSVPNSKPDGGKVSVSPRSASKGDTVTVTVTPDSGYELDKLTVTDKDGREILVTAKGGGKYTFTMPAGKVTVSAAFAAVSGSAPCGKADCPAGRFTDTSVTAWYHDGVHYCVENGLMVGYGDDTFRPNGSTTRAMLTVMLWRLNGSPVVNYALDYSDVEEGAWYTEAVRWAASENVVQGYGNGKFGPNDTLTREQMVTILWRYAKYKGVDVSVGEDTNILSYADALTVGEYAIPAMQWACGSGTVQGTTDGRLEPKGSATRAQAAAILMRYCENIVK